MDNNVFLNAICNLGFATAIISIVVGLIARLTKRHKLQLKANAACCISGAMVFGSLAIGRLMDNFFDATLVVDLILLAGTVLGLISTQRKLKSEAA